jgi:hypothetical protein
MTFKHISAAVLLILAPVSAQAQTAPANDEIIKLIKAGMPESVIMTKVNDLRAGLDKSTDALIALRTAGASDNVLAAVLSDKAVAVVAAAVPARALNPSMTFKNGEVEFVSLLIATDVIRVNLSIRNTTEKPIYLWNGSDQNRDCQQVSLTDELGNDFKCGAETLYAMSPYADGDGGKTILPNTSFNFQYSFIRTGIARGKSFSFTTSPYLTIPKDPAAYANVNYPHRNDKFSYEALGITFSDLPAKVRPVGK